jgi:hypothetical protein
MLPLCFASCLKQGIDPKIEIHGYKDGAAGQESEESEGSAEVTIPPPADTAPVAKDLPSTSTTKNSELMITLDYYDADSSGFFMSTNVGLTVYCNQGGAAGTGTFFGKACN